MITHDPFIDEALQRTIDRFWDTFPPVWSMVRGNIRRIVSEHFDVTEEQFHDLRHIRKGIRSVSELATVKQVSRPAISQSLDALVEKGLITRHVNAEDRRYVELELTPAGDELLNAIFKMNQTWMMDKLARLNREELAYIIQGLKLLKTGFEENAM
jgi:DNA-binding MarR family transcriptional regulator